MSTNKNNADQSTDTFVMPSVFGMKPPDALLVPNTPISVRNNCQIGQWVIGDKSYGSKCSMTVLKYSKFFGELGQTKDAQWGQLWFVAEAGDLPQGMVMVTYIKSRGLQNFGHLVASIMAQGIEPATGIFTCEFVGHSGQGPDDYGVVKPRNYFSLKWDWKERTDAQYGILKQAAAVLTDPAQMGNLVDIEGTKKLIQTDGFSPEQLARLLQKENINDAIGTLPDARMNALTGSSDFWFR